MYELLGISLVLATLLTINAAASMLAAAIWRLLGPRLQNISARARAELLFALRVGPPLLALLAVGMFLIPSYIGYEPYATPEVVSKKLAILAIVSAAGVLLALWRFFRSWLATHLLLRRWLGMADRITLPEVSIPTFHIDHSFPILAVAGTIKPRLFVATSVLQALTGEELRAAIAHEAGHLAAHDNLKRALLRACRDALMIVPCGRSLDRAWVEAVETAADECAVEKDRNLALDLAAALVKIARLVPVGAKATMPLASYLIGSEETPGVKARIRRLLEIAGGSAQSVKRGSFYHILPTTAVCLFILAAGMVMTNRGVLLSVHSLVERAVAVLC